MKSLPVALMIAAATSFWPLAVAADTNLQPPLDQILVAPPNGYSALAIQGYPHGFFGLDEFASLFGAKDVQDASQTLQQEGFVGGYSLTWVDGGRQHALIEYVVAFSGGKGASAWFSYARAADFKDPTYRHPDAASGLGDQWYGEHNVFSNNDVGDAFIFVKGNDLLVVGFISKQDDVLALATQQATSQYARAPDHTISRDQWPENARPSSDSFPLTGVLIALVFVAALGGIGGVVFVMMRRRELTSTVSATPAAPPVALQMSADNNFWFDGARWVDVAVEAPPFAQRSPDGGLWWDGWNWRPVPGAVRQR